MAKSFIPAAVLDFDSYKASLKTFLKGQERFKDYDFEGSNLAVLVDLLAYNTFNNAHYLNMIGSEMFIDSAQLRQSIVSHAKELNYTPRSAISARATVQIEVIPNDDPIVITIPKHYGFRSTAGDSSIRFCTDQEVVIRRDANGRYISDAFEIFEGQIVRETFNVGPVTDNNGVITYDQRFILQSENADISSIEVGMLIDSNDLEETAKNRAENLYGLDGKSQVFFLRGYLSNNYEIEFGDNVLGAAVAHGNIINVSYRDTVGTAGNGSYVFAKNGSIDGYSNISVTTLSPATGGADREVDASIKYNAVRHFQTQDRAVIEQDYEILIKQAFPEIQEVNVYGGERVANYGKVIIVLKPHNVDGVVSNQVKRRVLDFLKGKALVPESLIEDPEYFYLKVDGNVFYRPQATSDSINQVTSAAVNAIVDLNDSVLADFNTTVYQSTINTAIDESHPAIDGSDIKLSVIRKIYPAFGTSRQYEFTVDNPLYVPIEGEYTSTDHWTVSTNVFKMIIDDVIWDVRVQDNGLGVLHLYQIADGSAARLPQSVGLVDYETGYVTFTVDVYSVAPSLDVTCALAGRSITVSLNKFISVASSDVNLVVSKYNVRY